MGNRIELTDITPSIRDLPADTDRKQSEALQAAQKRVLELAIQDAPLAQALEMLVRTVESQSQSQMLGSILLLDSDGLHLRHGAAPSLPEAYKAAIDGIAVGPAVGSCGTAAYSRKPVYVSDIATSPLWIDFRNLAASHELKACWSTPILSSRDELLGTFAMYYRESHAASSADLELVDTVTRTASLVIERKQAEEALRRRTAQFETLLREVPLGVYLVDADFRIREVNPTALPVFGDIPDLIGRDFDEVVHILWPKDYADELVRLFRRTLDSGEPSTAPERIEKRRDRGVVEYYEWQINRIPLPDGRYGVVCYFRDISAQVWARQTIADSEARYRALFDSAPMAVFVCDRNAVIQHYNQRAVELWGREPLCGVEQHCGSVKLWLPNGALLPHAQSPMVDVLRTGMSALNVEVFIERPDGLRLPVLVNFAALKDAQGEITGVITSFIDITERKQVEEQTNLLLGEMSHRVKNLFAVTGGMIALSARSARTPQDMAASVMERLGALTRAHELTRPGLIDAGDSADRDTTLHVLIRTLFAPYVISRTKGDEGIILTGPDLRIGGNAITNVALVLHELATNAAKYGALSGPGGVVHIDCSTEHDQLLLTWKELGGPKLKGEPGGEGFGGLLTRRIIRDQFGGQLSREWESEGLIVRLSMPLKRLSA